MSKNRGKRHKAQTVAREHRRTPKFKANVMLVLDEAIKSTFYIGALALGFACMVLVLSGKGNEDTTRDIALWLKVAFGSIPVLFCWRFLIRYVAQYSELIDCLTTIEDYESDTISNLLRGMFVASLITGVYILLLRM